MIKRSVGQSGYMIKRQTDGEGTMLEIWTASYSAALFLFPEEARQLIEDLQKELLSE